MLMLLRGGKRKTFRIDNISPKVWRRIKKCGSFRCGLNMPVLSDVIRVPDLIFKNSCEKHDLMTRRGGGLLDWFDTNYYFWLFTYRDVDTLIAWLGSRAKNMALINAILYLFVIFIIAVLLYVIATIYNTLATIGTIFVFNWGRYRRLSAILKKAKC